MPVYLLHFYDPLADVRDWPLHHAHHYLGSAGDVDARVAEHRAGQGARLVEVAIERGLDFQVACILPGARVEERQLKRRHGSGPFCPICNQTRKDGRR